MAQVKLSITVQEDWRDRYAAVVENCRRAGLDVEQELVAIGVIIGCADEGCVAALANTEGILAVETARTNQAYSPTRPD